MIVRIFGVTLVLITLYHPYECFQLQPRIVNGHSSERGQFPFFAFLDIKFRFQPKKVFTCGGSLVSNQWVLTAAHCTYNATKIAVHLGSHEQNEYEEGRHVFFARKKHFYIHPEYDEETLWNDIALIKLPRPAAYSRLIQPISFPKTCDIPSGMDLIVIGNGMTNAEGGQAEILKYTTLRTIPHFECQKEFSYDINSLFCAKGFDKNGACEGDSGGPIFSQNDHSIYGIASFAHEDGCEGLPQGYTNVFYFLPWIKEITQSKEITNCNNSSNFPNTVTKLFRNYVLRKPDLYMV